MHGVAFSLGPLSVHWYGIFAALGFLSAVLALQLNRKKAGLTQDDVFNFAFIAIGCGILGARLFYVIQFWPQFAGKPLDIIRIDKGGLVFYGGFIFALICVMLYCFIKKINVFRLLDIFAPAIAIAHAFGRIGCYLQGCCFGKPGSFLFSVTYPYGTPGAQKFPLVKPDPYAEQAIHSASCPLYPVQLYECGLNLLLFVFLLWLLKKLKRPGGVASAYLAGYALMRFSMEFLRGDHAVKDYLFGIFTPSQSIALFLMLPFAMVMFLYSQMRQERNLHE